MVGALEADGADDDAPLLVASATMDDAAAPNPGSTEAAVMAAVNDPGLEIGSGVGCFVGGLGAVAEASAVVMDADDGIDTLGTVGIISVGLRTDSAPPTSSLRNAAAASSR